MKTAKITRLLFLPAVLLLLISCRHESEKIKVAVSYVSGDPAQNNYIRWLSRVNPDAEFVAMYGRPSDSVALLMDRCSGLLLTGGEDIYPGRYGREFDTVRCGSINPYRDSLEFGLLDHALKHNMPVMGVCRGQQLINVALGGSLYVDIPTDIKTTVLHRCTDWRHCYHEVVLLPGNLLKNLARVPEGVVTTNHHQAVDRLADPLRVMAVSDDGVIESVGWRDTLGKGYLLGVQWHPERMDSISPLARPLAEKFMQQVAAYQR